YPEEFAGKTRSVYLFGEANFQVKPDEKHPFIVKANDFQITALGTEFNVNAIPDNTELIATLLEGCEKEEFNNLISNV
ncbi:FecR domain-containing protein, partial [Bacteroides thetaiotaomicron]|uniref:FecR domain-containing protein n=1 Tax=Bacteroides thetaiotaomicron TaxID=818 RepID=UPI002109080B